MVTLICRNYTRHHHDPYDMRNTKFLSCFVFVTRFTKKRLIHTQFQDSLFIESPSVNAPTAHVFKNAEGWTVCFNSCDQAFFSSLTDVHECSGGLKWPHMHLPLASR